MTYKEFKREVYRMVGENGSIVEKTLYNDERNFECECIVLEGGYEPCRMRFWLDENGDIRGGYR